MKTTIEVTLAGLTIPCALSFPEAAKYFPRPDPSAPRVDIAPVAMQEDDWDAFLVSDMERCAHSEYSILTANFSDALMDYNRMLFHAVAVRWRGRAYLIAAASGTGKTTQARTLQKLCPGEFDVICGDRPVLEFRRRAARQNAVPLYQKVPDSSGQSSAPQAGSSGDLSLPKVTLSPEAAARLMNRRAAQDEWDVIVHPSCWNGKENWYGAPAAPLAGLILLDRGEENKISRMMPRDAAVRTYVQVIQTSRDAAGIHKAAELTTRLLNSVPIWSLTSFQVPDSTRLLLEKVF